MKYLLLAQLAWGIQAPPDWTLAPDDPAPLVRVEWWFSANGVPITPTYMYYLHAGRTRDLPVNPDHYGSGQEICLHGRSKRITLATPREVAEAVPVCVIFPADYSLLPPTFCTPKEIP